MLNKNKYPAIIKAFALRAIAAAFLFAAFAGAPAGAQELFDIGQDNSAFATLLKGSGGELPVVPDVKAVAPSTAPANPGSNEQLHFWEQLKDDVFDNVCKQAQIDLNQGASLPNIGGISGQFKRLLRQYPDRKIGLIDEVGIKLNGGHTFSDALGAAGASVHVGFSATLEGKSIVVRKLGESKYCKVLPTIADLRKVKTILPINAERITGMQTGEIWKFPMAFHAGFSGGAGAAVQPWVTLSFSLGAEREMKPSVTLYKLSEDALRLRVRLDNATILRAGASVGTSFNAGVIGLPQAENFLLKALENTVTGAVVREINQYIAVRFGLSASRTKGKKILLEFVLDPKDPDQTAKLVDFLKGDLGIIRKLIDMGVHFTDFSSQDDEMEGNEELGEVEHVASDTLDTAASYAGSDHYTSSQHNFSAVLPVVLNYNRSSGQRYDRYQSLDGEEVVHVRNAFRNRSAGNLNIPVLGKVFKHDVNQNFYVVNYEDKDGKVSDAAVIYQRYEGYVHHSEKDARKMVENMNDILKYAGAKGEGSNENFTVDTDSLFPRLAAMEDGEKGVHAKRYSSAMLSFSLAFAKEAVTDIITAPPALIMKAAMNVMEGVQREIISKVLPLIGVDGSYDKETMRAMLAPYEATGYDALNILHDFARDAAELVTDLAGLATIGDPTARSERLSKVLAGKSESRLGYDKLMKIVIQLVDVKNINASLTVKTDKRIKGEDNISNTYNMYNQNNDGPQLSNVNALRDRFADPSALSD